jgi:hypothetical protein
MRLISSLILALILCVLCPASALCQADLGLRGVGLGIGLVDPDNVDATFGFGLLADLGRLSEPIQLEANLSYWSKSEGMSGFGEASVRDISFGGRCKYYFPTESSSLRPFAGAGLGLHFFKAKASIPDLDIGGFIVPGTTIEDSSVKLGLDLGGGLATPINEKADVIGELWYSLVSDIDQLSFRLGVMYKLGM